MSSVVSQPAMRGKSENSRRMAALTPTMSPARGEAAIGSRTMSSQISKRRRERPSLSSAAWPRKADPTRTSPMNVPFLLPRSRSSKPPRLTRMAQ